MAAARPCCERLNVLCVNTHVFQLLQSTQLLAVTMLVKHGPSIG